MITTVQVFWHSAYIRKSPKEVRARPNKEQFLGPKSKTSVVLGPSLCYHDNRPGTSFQITNTRNDIFGM